MVKNWLKKMFKDPFTLACDLDMFWRPHNQQEVLIHVNGLFFARWKARRWCYEHPQGQARILEGHVYWEDNK